MSPVSALLQKTRGERWKQREQILKQYIGATTSNIYSEKKLHLQGTKQS